MKKIVTVLSLLSVILLWGCGSRQIKETVSMYDLRKAMEAADQSLPEMLNVSSSEENAEKNFSYISEMKYEKLDSFFISYSKEGKADEIVVIAVKDMADIDEAKKSLEEHRESRHKLLEQYEPEQVKRIDDGIIFTKDQYAVLIICDDTEAVRKAFESVLGTQQSD